MYNVSSILTVMLLMKIPIYKLCYKYNSFKFAPITLVLFRLKVIVVKIITLSCRFYLPQIYVKFLYIRFSLIKSIKIEIEFPEKSITKRTMESMRWFLLFPCCCVTKSIILFSFLCITKSLKYIIFFLW